MAERVGIARDVSGEVTHRAHIPIIHALLPGQDEETYKRLFQIVRTVYPQLRPTHFKSDYERAQINAIKHVYRGITCEGDSFHLFQAVHKKVQKMKLGKLYRDDIEVYDQVSYKANTILTVGEFSHVSCLGSTDADSILHSSTVDSPVLDSIRQAADHAPGAEATHGLRGADMDR